MKHINIDFIQLGRKYRWSYAPKDSSVVNRLLLLAKAHSVKIDVISGFTDEEKYLLENQQTSRAKRRPMVSDIINNSIIENDTALLLSFDRQPFEG